MGPYREQLVREIVAGFATPDSLRTWLGELITDANTCNILTGDEFDAQALNMVLWAEATGRQVEILQALADHPPRNDPRLPVLITGWTLGVVMTAINAVRARPPRSSGAVPAMSTRSWRTLERRAQVVSF
jgi:hypothetical protein